jgi:hypothetical protein
LDVTRRLWIVPLALGALALGLAGLGVEPASAASVSVKVRPSSNLTNGKTVTITGRGLVTSYQGAAQTWFATECTPAVHGHLDPQTDTPHCDITHAVTIKVSHNGTFTSRYHVVAGIIGDGYCGTVGHLTCVIGIGTAQGLGTVVRVSFKPPAATSGIPETTG